MRDASDQAGCRAELARLLNEEAAALTLLETQLLREHTMLLEEDLEGLESAGKARQACVARLLQIEDTRRTLCRRHDRAVDYKGVEQLLYWCDPAASLLPLLRDCMDRATRCRDQNLRNGALVNARLLRVSNALGLLDGAAQTARTYGRRGGSAIPAPRAGRGFDASV